MKNFFSLVLLLALTLNGIAAAQGPEPPSGAGTAITFVADEDGDYEIYTLDLSKRVVSRVTDNASQEWYPDWSPDGSRIAFGSNRDGDYEIFVMDAGGSNLQQLTTNEASDLDPVWSPDGTQIAFISQRDGPAKVFVMNADGTNQRALSSESTPHKDPSWLDDDLIIFAAQAGGADPELIAVGTDGTPGRTYTDNDADDGHPVITPNGRFLAFHSDRDGNYEIYTLDLFTDRVSRITNDPATDAFPTWSPDGERLAFQSDRDGDYEIFVVNADGTGVEQYTTNATVDIGAAWVPLAASGGSNGSSGPIISPPDDGGNGGTSDSGGSSSSDSGSESTSAACTVVSAYENASYVRYGPDTEFQLVGYLREEPMPVIGYNDGWYQIDMDGQKGWIGQAAVKMQGDCEEVPYVTGPTPEPTEETPESPDWSVNFTVNGSNAATVSPGDCATVKWQTSNVKEVYYEGSGVSGNGERSECPSATTTYTLDVTLNDDSTRSYTVTINVSSGGATVSFTVNGGSTDTINEGDCTTLKWQSENVKEVYFEGSGVSGNDQREVCPTSDTSYQLKVIYQDNSESFFYVTVYVNPVASYTCGDHLCSTSEGETAAECAADCNIQPGGPPNNGTVNIAPSTGNTAVPVGTNPQASIDLSYIGGDCVGKYATPNPSLKINWTGPSGGLRWIGPDTYYYLIRFPGGLTYCSGPGQVATFMGSGVHSVWIITNSSGLSVSDTFHINDGP
jgi:Tol biopolymer transport system component